LLGARAEIEAPKESVTTMETRWRKEKIVRNDGGALTAST